MGGDADLPDLNSMDESGSDAIARRGNEIALQPAQIRFIHLRREDVTPTLPEGIRVETFAESDPCPVIGATIH